MQIFPTKASTDARAVQVILKDLARLNDAEAFDFKDTNSAHTSTENSPEISDFKPL